MKKHLALGAVLALGLPGVALAADDAPTAKQNAAQACRAEQKANPEVFTTTYGGKKNAFGKCVSQTARKDAAEDAKQREQARKNASQQCREERASGEQAFNERYGTNANNKNAFGKCVSQKARENKQEADEQDEAEEQQRLNAAQRCKAARKASSAEFAKKYGEKRNAFGKCVSQTARGEGETPQS